jgi:undecaprenyl-diphosphatase
MPLLQVVILAIIQGLTEFLPVSSSAHLALAPMLFGWKDQGLDFDAVLHVGTTISVLLYFFRDWLQIAANGLGWRGARFKSDSALDRNPWMLWWLVLATIPAGIAGLLLKDAVETTFRSPYVMGSMLIVVALVMWLAEKRATQKRGIGEMTLTDCLVIGCAQVLALVPGTSRSGITMTVGLARDLDRATAARFSFLLSTPIVVPAALKGVVDLWKHGGLGSGSLPIVLLGIGVSALTGCLVIAFLLRFLRTNTFLPFVIYRVIFGIIVIALAIARS